MRIEAAEEHLVVISDLHLGNPASTARERLLGFFDDLRRTDAALCINGDGFEMLQGSFSRVAMDARPVLNRLKVLQAEGRNVYYVVGNHDIVLEHFLEDWALTRLSPFLNVRSGGRRIRVEHGHLYDPFFTRTPRLYGQAHRVARYALFAAPDTYALWAHSQRKVEEARRRRAGAAPGPVAATGLRSPYHEAASMILRRGFDAVVFGHTHSPELVELPEGTYANSGNWLAGSSYVEIKGGDLAVRNWDGAAPPY